MRALTPFAPIAFVLSLLVALPVGARPLGDAEQAGLTKAVDAYGRATTDGDAAKIVATIPPRILSVFAGSTGLEAKKVEETLVGQTKDLMKNTKISGFVVAPGPFDATDATLADGTALVWVIVPAQFNADTNGQKTLNHQPLFAVLEDGHWYFSRVDGPQQQQVVAMAYPFIAEAKLPAAQSTPAP